MYHPVVIFALDNQTEAGEFELWAFADNMGFPRPQKCQGSYKGQTEASYIMAEGDFNRFMRAPATGSFMIQDQESVLRVSGCNKAYAILDFMGKQPNIGLGSMVAVSEEVALKEDAWTKRLGQYYICRKMNPDHHKELENAS